MKEVAQSGNIGPDADHCRATSRLVTEEVERVARALYDHWRLKEDSINEYCNWDRLPDKETWRERATAALEAMRASSAGGEVVERVYELRDLAAHNADKWTVELCDDIIIALQSQPPSNEARLREARNSWAALIGTNAAGSEDAPRIVAELNAELAALSNEGNG